MKREDVNAFAIANSQLVEMYNEISVMSKKKPNDSINLFKLKFINKIISDANSIMGIEHKPFSDFELFDEDDLPNNSDITVMFSQYLNAMEKFRCDNIENDYSGWYWVIDGRKSEIEATHPSIKFKRA